MKAIKVKGFQTSANYKIPGSHQLRETYPLPPYSTVIGMVHKACDFKEYVPMDISIQGNYQNVIDEAFIRYEFKPEFKYDSSRHQLKIPTSKGEYGIGRGLGHVQLLVGVFLIFHIVPKNKEYIETIYKGLNKPVSYLAIGRHEDLFRIDSIEIVELEETEVESFELINNYYIPLDLFEKTERELLQGTVYDITKNYSISNNIRVWDKRVEVLYSSGRTYNNSDFYLDAYKDTDGDYVFLA